MRLDPWITDLVDRLAREPLCGYRRGLPAATEPTALAALALMAHGRLDAARTALDWLLTIQAGDGSLGIGATENTPCWPTALAIVGWQRSATLGIATYATAAQRATKWLLAAHGEAQPRTPEMGHDSTLVGWAWVPGTHSWIEPTAWSVLALKAGGHSQHRRTREAVRLLQDRLLPEGGCNYGNTVVLGQPLRPHVQPTGLTLLALAGERATSRVRASLAYLRNELSAATTVASLCYGLLALAAHDEYPEAAGDWLASAAERERRHEPSGLKAALLVLAASKGSGVFFAAGGPRS